MTGVKTAPKSGGRKVNTRHLGAYAATAAVGLGVAGAALAGAPVAEAGGVHYLGCQGNTQEFCTYPTGHYLSYAFIGTNTTAHQLCIYYTNSVGTHYGGCTANDASYDFYSTPATRKKSMSGHTRLDESIYWKSAFVEYSS